MAHLCLCCNVVDVPYPLASFTIPTVCLSERLLACHHLTISSRARLKILNMCTTKFNHGKWPVVFYSKMTSQGKLRHAVCWKRAYLSGASIPEFSEPITPYYLSVRLWRKLGRTLEKSLDVGCASWCTCRKMHLQYGKRIQTVGKVGQAATTRRDIAERVGRCSGQL